MQPRQYCSRAICVEGITQRFGSFPIIETCPNRIVSDENVLNTNETEACPQRVQNVHLKDKYPNFEVGLKCIPMVFPYLLLCSYINENSNAVNRSLTIA